MLSIIPPCSPPEQQWETDNTSSLASQSEDQDCPITLAPIKKPFRCPSCKKKFETKAVMTWIIKRLNDNESATCAHCRAKLPVASLQNSIINLRSAKKVLVMHALSIVEYSLLHLLCMGTIMLAYCTTNFLIGSRKIFCPEIGRVAVCITSFFGVADLFAGIGSLRNSFPIGCIYHTVALPQALLKLMAMRSKVQKSLRYPLVEMIADSDLANQGNHETLV